MFFAMVIRSIRIFSVVFTDFADEADKESVLSHVQSACSSAGRNQGPPKVSFIGTPLSPWMVEAVSKLKEQSYAPTVKYRFRNSQEEGEFIDETDWLQSLLGPSQYHVSDSRGYSSLSHMVYQGEAWDKVAVIAAPEPGALLAVMKGIGSHYPPENGEPSFGMDAMLLEAAGPLCPPNPTLSKLGTLLAKGCVVQRIQELEGKGCSESRRELFAQFIAAVQGDTGAWDRLKAYADQLEALEQRRKQRAKVVGFPEATSWDRILAEEQKEDEFMMKALRAAVARSFGVDWHIVSAAARLADLLNAPEADIASPRAEAAKELGLPEEATWQQIQDEEDRRSLAQQLVVPEQTEVDELREICRARLMEKLKLPPETSWETPTAELGLKEVAHHLGIDDFHLLRLLE